MSEPVQSERPEQAVVPNSDPLVGDMHVEHEEIEARSLYQHDPLLVLLKDRLHLADYWILLGCFALPTLIYSLWLIWMLATPSTHLLTQKTIVSILLQCIVIFPLLFLMYLRLPHWFADLFNKLRHDDVIGRPRPGSHGPSSYARFVQLVTLWTDKWWWVAGAIALNVVYLSFRLSFVEIPGGIPTPLGLRCLSLLVYTPLMYAAFLSIARIVAAFVALNGLLITFTIHVRPLHPDGSGGLGTLRRIIWISIVMLIWDALLLYSGVTSQSMSLFSPFEMSLLGVIYVVLVPCVLVGWLFLPHLIMVKARENVLLPLSRELSQIMIETSLASPQDIDTFKLNTQKITELKQQYDFVHDNFPTWPVHLQTLSRFIIALILPALLPVLIDHLPQLFSWLTQPWLH